MFEIVIRIGNGHESAEQKGHEERGQGEECEEDVPRAFVEYIIEGGKKLREMIDDLTLSVQTTFGAG